MIRLLIIICVILASCSVDKIEDVSGSQTNIYDDFDLYSAGEFLGIESNGLWTTWSGAAGSPEDAYITNEVSYSPDNCVKLVSGGVSDVILPLGNESSGGWTLTYMLFVEEGYGAYFNLLHLLSNDSSNWAVQVFFNASGNGQVVIGSGAGLDSGTTFVYPTGSWFEVKVNINIDEDVAELYFDDAPIYNWSWSEGSTEVSSSISAINFYPNAQDDEPDSYFIDNFSFHEYGF